MGVIAVDDFQKSVKVTFSNINSGDIKLLYLGEEDKEIEVSLPESFRIETQLAASCKQRSEIPLDQSGDCTANYSVYDPERRC